MICGLCESSELALDETFYKKIQKLKAVFEELSISEQEQVSSYDTTKLNCSINFQLESYTLTTRRGIESLEAKVLIHKLFSECFQLVISPYYQDKSDIISLSKSNKDCRILLNNHPITIMHVIDKLNVGILNRSYKYTLKKIKYCLKNKIGLELEEVVLITFLH